MMNTRADYVREIDGRRLAYHQHGFAVHHGAVQPDGCGICRQYQDRIRELLAEAHSRGWRIR